MEQLPGTDARPRRSRRRPFTRVAVAAVTCGLVATVAATGCTPSDPRVHPGAAATANGSVVGSATPSATPIATLTAAAGAAEQSLADLAGFILTGPHRAQLSAAQRRTLTAIAEAHGQHAADLLSPQPTSRIALPPSPRHVSPPAGFEKLTLAASLHTLVTAEQQQAARLRPAARSAAGLQALLLGSLAIGADAYAQALRTQPPLAVSRPPARPAAMPTMSDIAAEQAVVTQLHGLIYGYQVALGRLSRTSASGRRASADLAARRRLRDRLVEVLLSRSASVPVAAAAYVPSVSPSDAARSAELIRQMETRFEPFCGIWVASSARSSDRRLALDTLADTVGIAQSWGAAVGAWPGWVD